MNSTYEENALSNQISSAHKRTSSFSYRVPTPPRIVIPPPIVSTDFRDLSIDHIAPQGDRELDLSFLNNVDYAKLTQDSHTLEWTYERRREAQAILPFLYLGPMSRAKDKVFLQKEQITMMVAVRPKQSGLTNAAFTAANELGVEIATVDAPSPQELIAVFPTAIKRINIHLYQVYQRSLAMEPPKLGKVLIFCESGNDKSAALVAAYITEMFDKITHIKAMQICQAQRFCVNFDDTSKQLLQTYHGILTAKRNVTQPANGNGYRKQKRNLDRDEDDTEAMDLERFDGRVFTPYS
ncbi:phosphatases II [Pseudovirgaria hyperparasitica]|uniref:Phosphatases II n=1 Tax=Pseudovirgaria hyperparasitica TaxID=470096 RepID=A0A6A6WEX5_9PEZI|nr:phosphatases II [Pseudovirgaria hyperparasitica]KAF2760540.1 phosphatases II [Pseudovirgaria hyperparasitica]